MDSLFLALAAAEAEPYTGATSPNPPVGAVVVREGKVLAAAAHERAGLDHAEVKALKRALETAGAQAVRGATLYATLEPCNHFGRTPPCTRAIIEAGIARVVFAERDPNPHVAGGGAKALSAAGIAVVRVKDHAPSRALIAGFAKHSLTGRPWVILKRALRARDDGSLSPLPSPGSRTFTSPESLTAAHRERRRSDAIVTGIGTVLADLPLFNVRRVPDHPGKSRLIVVLSKKGRALPAGWLARQAELKHEVIVARSPIEALDALGKRGALRALVEAGPRVTEAFERAALWDERLTFVKRLGEQADVIYREGPCSLES